MSEVILLFFNRLRFIFHGLLVPLLIIFSAYALNVIGKYFYIHLSINIILSLIGVIIGIITKLKIVEDTVLKRCNFSEDASKFDLIMINIMNIGCVLYMIVVGVLLFIKKKEYFFFLSGFFMLLFSAIGPAVGMSELNYILSIYGEILMIIFLYLFFKKNVVLIDHKEVVLNNE